MQVIFDSEKEEMTYITSNSRNKSALGERLFNFINKRGIESQNLLDFVKEVLDIDNFDTRLLTTYERYQIYLKTYNYDALHIEDISFQIQFIVDKEKTLECYLIEHKEDYALLELSLLLKLNKTVRICRRCGKYFITKGNYNGIYCSRVNAISGLTCVRIASNEDYQKRVENSPILREYARAYKRMYSYIRKGFPKSEFEDWVTNMTNKRDYYDKMYKTTNDESYVEEFRELLGNKPKKKRNM